MGFGSELSHSFVSLVVPTDSHRLPEDNILFETFG